MTRTSRSAVLLAGLLFSVTSAWPDQAAVALAKAKPAAAIAQTKETQAAITPAIARRRLAEGNVRFMTGRMRARDLRAQVQATAGGQYPFASVLGCMDSRAAPELVFDQGIGDVFAPRIAGNVLDDDILGSLEYASKVAGARLIVVLGHTECGAVKGACDKVQLGHLTGLLTRLQPALDAVPDAAPRDSTNHDFVQRVAEANVRLAVAQIRDQSAILKAMVDKGDLAVVGAMYDIHTGKVAFYDDK